MHDQVKYEDVLVAVTIEGIRGNIQLAVGEEFHGQTVIALEACYTMLNKNSDTKSIKVIFEDESYIWIDLPQNQTVQRRYHRIAVDGPVETK